MINSEPLGISEGRNMFDTLTKLLLNKCFAIALLSLLGKLFLFFFFLYTIFKTQKSSFLTLLLSLFLLGTIFENLISLILIGIRHVYEYEEFFPRIAFVARIHWALFVTYYQSLALFLLYLPQKKVSFSSWHIPHIIANIVISLGFLNYAFTFFNIPSWSLKTMPDEVHWSELANVYIFILFLLVYYQTYQYRSNRKTPLILASQVRYLQILFVAPLILEILDTAASPTSLLNRAILYLLKLTHVISPTSDFAPFAPTRYYFFTLKAALATCAMYFAIKKIMGLRFLNMHKTIQSKERFNFLEQFQDIIDQLNATEDIRAIIYPVQNFFSAAFGISVKQIDIFIRKNNSFGKAALVATSPEHFGNVEQILALDSSKALIQTLRSTKICVKDDIHFTQFSEDDDTRNAEMLNFLEAIQADIFLPIFERGSLIAYIIIDQGTRTGKLFTNKERDEMLVFTSYLSNIINVLTQSTVEALHLKANRLSEEIYVKHQENNQLRECLRSCMRSAPDRKIATVYYRRKFTFANDIAEEIIGIDLNKNEGHPLTQAFKSVAHLVQQYKCSQSTFAYDVAQRRVVITGLLGQDGFSVILYMYYPDISEVVTSQLTTLKDPSLWDYVLYLETTQSGQLVNKLIPGSTEKILTFKADLLTTALSKKATLLDLPEDDLLPTVGIIHSISLRETLHTLKLIDAEKNHNIALTLFGLSPFIERNMPALLEQLDAKGTLFIQNVELLSVETQNMLAHFLAHGFFYHYRSDHKIFSTVRVICSSHKNLKQLVAEGTFSSTLYEELEPRSLTMPSIHTFSEEEITKLAQGFADQITLSQTDKNPSSLTTKNSKQLLADRPISLNDLRKKVSALITKRTSPHTLNLVSESQAIGTLPTDADAIVAAVHLGKKALRNPQMMAVLWHKFKNRSKIATILGVNISTVSRWCQKYNLQ